MAGKRKIVESCIESSRSTRVFEYTVYFRYTVYVFYWVNLGIKYSLTSNFGYKAYLGFLNFVFLHEF